MVDQILQPVKGPLDKGGNEGGFVPPMPQTPLQQAPIQQVPVRPQQTANITKPTSNISIRGVLIGCGILFMFVIGGLSLVFYNLMNNPSQLSSVGLDPNTTKTLLQTFSVIFFGLITFLGIGLLIANLYRLITVKNKSKVGYIFGALL
ncbi:TPA: hypothetical protein DCZ39_06815 [Patescibacteria group bacterium]|nr:hypothetical protein [Candidatus Gracilibacteria bacterium]